MTRSVSNLVDDTPPGTASPGRTASQILSETRQLIQDAYRTAVGVLPAEVQHVVGYHVGWWDADGRPCDRAGKAVRPALTLACARAANPAYTTGNADGVLADRMVAAAVAVELVHDFSLLHDDVIDGDQIRRQRPAAWTVFGIDQAILVGDVLLTSAVQQLAAAGLGGAGRDSAVSVRVLARTLQELCRGQSADLAFEKRTDVSVAECLAMADGKTGALLGAACELGVLAAGASEKAADRYREFGRNLGLAYQFVDDMLGIWGDPRVTGKPAGSDLASHKKSLPVVAALASGTAAGERLARLYAREDTLDEHAITHAAALVEAAGGRDWAQREAKRYTQAALHALAEVSPDPAAAADLYVLAALITGRDR